MPKDFINDKSPLVLVMAGVLSGNKPIPEPMMTKLHDTINDIMAYPGANELKTWTSIHIPKQQ